MFLFSKYEHIQQLIIQIQEKEFYNTKATLFGCIYGFTYEYMNVSVYVFTVSHIYLDIYELKRGQKKEHHPFIHVLFFFSSCIQLIMKELNKEQIKLINNNIFIGLIE